MTKLFLQSGRILGLFFVAASAAFSGPIPLTIIQSIGPDASPSWDTYVLNAEYALQNSLSTYGPAGPAQYNVAPNPVPSGALINTAGSFTSWMGVADRKSVV